MKKQLKPLSRLSDKSRGSVHHVEIHPATNSHGKLGLRTIVHRNHPPAVQAAMDAGGPYQPQPQPEESIHEDPQDGIAQAAKAYGLQAHAPDDGDADED